MKSTSDQDGQKTLELLGHLKGLISRNPGALVLPLSSPA